MSKEFTFDVSNLCIGNLCNSDGEKCVIGQYCSQVLHMSDQDLINSLSTSPYDKFVHSLCGYDPEDSEPLASDFYTVNDDESMSLRDRVHRLKEKFSHYNVHMKTKGWGKLSQCGE